MHLFQTNGGDLSFNVAFIMDMNGDQHDQHGHELQKLEPLILIYFTGLSVKLLISLLKWILLFQKYQLPVTTLKTKSHVQTVIVFSDSKFAICHNFKNK